MITRYCTVILMCEGTRAAQSEIIETQTLKKVGPWHTPWE